MVDFKSLTKDDRQKASYRDAGGALTDQSVVIHEPDPTYLTTVDVVKTLITDAITQITTPDNSGDFYIYHQSNDTLYFGDEDETAASGAPVDLKDVVQFTGFKKNNENEIYAICDTGISITVYAVAGVKE